MIRGSCGTTSCHKKLYHPLSAALAWMPRNLYRTWSKYYFQPRADGESYIPQTFTRAIQRYDTNAKIPSRFYSSPSSTTTSQNEMEAADEINKATVATELAKTLCCDDLSSRASSTFAGIKYYNTDIDGRFRVLFVLGGPGTDLR
jgi:hypothetical protein